MVFGNRGDRSGSGVCFTRDPVSGEPGVFGDYLPDAQGEDVVSGSRSPMDLSELGRREPALHEELSVHLRTLEQHYRDLCDVEFTVEGGDCGSCRPASASGARQRPSASPSSSSTRGSSTSTRP